MDSNVHVYTWLSPEVWFYVYKKLVHMYSSLLWGKADNIPCLVAIDPPRTQYKNRPSKHILPSTS